MGTLPHVSVNNTGWQKIIDNVASGRVRNLTQGRCVSIIRQDAGSTPPNVNVSAQEIGDQLIGGTFDSEYSFGPLLAPQDIWARSMNADPCVLHVEV